MAKLPALISTLSRHDERDRPTLEHIARTVREAGYIPTTKRGIGASGMTTEAAVNLFLGLNGCDAPKDAARAVERFRSLRPRGLTLSESEQDALRKVGTAENFGIALEYLIDGTPSISKSLCEFFDEGFEESVSIDYKRDLLNLNWHILFPIQFDIVLHRHPYGARIILKVLRKRAAYYDHWKTESEPQARWRAASGEEADWHTEFNAEFLSDFDLNEKGFYGNPKSRRIAVTIPAKVLWDISRTLNSADSEVVGGTE
jgi:hypothetical protein